MVYLKKLFGLLFFTFLVLALWQCAKRGSPSGGPKDVTPPQLLRAEPENFTINFKEKKIRLYFDELIKLQDAQNQLVVSPPFKNPAEVKPMGTASKYIEVIIKDTLRENTTYTINFGQSIVDNNEGNPNNFLTYVFSTGDYIDSLTVSGAVKDAFNRKPDEFISVMLYEMDSTYTDSTVYKSPPLYLTSTGDSLPFFELKNLKAGKYALFGLKDVNKNNKFDQGQDKIGFVEDTITLPTDSIYLLNLFREELNYKATVPSFLANNKIIFGFQGDEKEMKIETLTQLPDSVRTKIIKERNKDTLNYWFTPTELDSIIFTVTNETAAVIDTFTVKLRDLPMDSLKLTSSVQRKFNLEDTFSIMANTPITEVDTSLITLNVSDSIPMQYSYALDSLENKIDFDFEAEPNKKYSFSLLPGAVTDFFGIQNDTLDYNLSTGSLADYGNLIITLGGDVKFPILVQLTNEKGEVKREIKAVEPQEFEFNNLDPGEYIARVIFDANENGKWDTGNYLKKIQPERISYYPGVIKIRANWIDRQNFILSN
ncbi:Ig-like domain-containing protein [Flagellimonas zhangzhouensis]|uniref:Ig-like domain-containing protein n=1 Tax=Flagellimonas zhangzhouensis TaxID=1073328 RepID=A0A1H2V7L7_9FLAO|nr:Ig-like domain-containing protein [Allomuricauda zhangzhouensis]SDQ10014.1 Ig-like domain-containing protein [Allomuricauda zhangzhouensis]SDW64336.1 Ig-like domain-containing protein [Allomuricauda zhangzhouensis]